MSTQPPVTPVISSERLIIGLISAVQFINILEFMMVMPLGPDFAKDLGIPVSHLGVIGGSYTASAAVAGIVAATFVERFDRRRALAFAMAGLILATVGAGFSTDLVTLLVARVAAGAFGGPATALALAIVADVIPPERRGKAMGTVMGAFALASIFGVPAGLELARIGSWRLPFFATAGLGLVVVALAIAKLPPLRGHLDRKKSEQAGPTLGEMIRRPVVLQSFAMATLASMAPFILIPNIAAYLQGNLHYPRADMGLLYLAGGASSFVAMRFVGKLTDRFGSFLIGTAGTLMLIVVTYLGFVAYETWLPVTGIFVGFMVAMSVRNVPYNSLVSMVPAPSERARFMSIQSSIQHVAAAAGAFLSARILVEMPDHSLANMEIAGWVTICMAMTLPFLLHSVQRHTRRAA